MKKKGTIGIVATLGIGLCAYALSQQPQAKEEKKNQIQYLQAEKKASSTASSKKGGLKKKGKRDRCKRAPRTRQARPVTSVNLVKR